MTNRNEVAITHRFALLAQMHPAYNFRGGTANLIKTMFTYPQHPFCTMISADSAGPNPLPGPWDETPTLSLFRPRSILPKINIGLGLLDNMAYSMQIKKVDRYLDAFNVKRQFVIITNFTRFALLVDSLTNEIPMDLYIIDDPVADCNLYRMSEQVAQKTFDRLMKHSNRVFTISPVYAEDMEKQYDKHCEFLPLPINDSLLQGKPDELPEIPQKTGKNTITIHHSGQIHHLYADALASLIPILNKIGEIRGMKINLELWGNIQTNHVQKSLKINFDEHKQCCMGNLTVKLCGEVPLEQLTNAQKRADLLLLVNSFFPTLERQIRCSFSSKNCEYMLSGVPIMVYAPSYSSLVHYFEKHKAGHVVSTRDKEEALKQIEAILIDPHKSRTVKKARSLAFELHSSENFFQQITQL
jgi:hypothetical protein